MENNINNNNIIIIICKFLVMKGYPGSNNNIYFA